MGTESKIEFKDGGTLYFSPLSGDVGIECPVGTIKVEDFEATTEPIDMPELNKIVNENLEFTGTVRLKFRGLVVLIGFWPAVRWTVRGWWCKFKNLWRLLRTPIEDE